jgi:hypothetical protein
VAASGLSLIVTGTGRCGTGYVSKVLQEAEVSSGHEAAYTYDGEYHVPGLRADVSWMAVPFLRDARARGIAVGLVYRHPAAVIASLLGIGFFEQPSPYLAFAECHCPEMDGLSPFDKACMFYNEWNRRALKECHFAFNVEFPAWDRVALALPAVPLSSLASAIPKVSQSYNHRNRSNIDTSLIHESVWTTYQMLEDAARAS